MNITVFTSVPEFFNGPLNCSLISRSIKKGIVNISIVDIKQYGIGKSKRIDDTPYGGGGGMILRADVVLKMFEHHNISPQTNCLNGNQNKNGKTSAVICTSPRGELFSQNSAKNIGSNIDNLYILSNRFEGVDQRIIEHYNITEISIGNYVLLGGEVASLAIIESSIRYVPNVILGKENPVCEDSFSGKLENMVEYDHYTKPRQWMDMEPPEELINGNHLQIEKWRKGNATKKTQNRLAGKMIDKKS